VEDLVPHIPSTAYRAVTVRDKTSWTFTLAVRLPGLGKVRLVISFKNAELTGTYAVLVSNRVDWDARRIITLYVQRWPIELFQSQDIKFTWGTFFFLVGRNLLFFKGQHVMYFDRPLWVHHDLFDQELDHGLAVLIA